VTEPLRGAVPAPRSLRRLSVWAGIALTVVFAALAVRGVHLRDVGNTIRASDIWWLVPALALTAAGTLMRAQRWRVLFTPEVRAQALVAISKRMDDNRKVNAALQVGRTPNTVIDLLEGLREIGLHEHFLVIGTNSLYAYETHAGVRFDGDITATLDVHLLWDSRKRVALSCDVDFNERGLLGVLKRIDSSFHLLEDQKYRAINDKGYMVDLIKRRLHEAIRIHEASKEGRA